MDEDLHIDLTKQIREISIQVPGIRYTEKCYVRKAGMSYQVDLHAVVDAEISVREGHDLAHKLQDTLQQQIPEISNILIHIEPDDY